MKFSNMSVAILNKDNQVVRIVNHPHLPSVGGKPVLPGNRLRKMMSVREIMQVLGISRNKASALRRSKPEKCLVG